MNLPRTFVVTCDSYNWALKPFSVLYNKYFSTQHEVVYCTYKKPNLQLPSNFTYFQIDKNEYPSEKWSNGLMRILDRSPDEYIILMLEDYWLARMVDLRAINKLYEWMKDHRNVLRFDLTDDRQYNGHSEDIGYIGEYDILRTPHGSEYNMSFQAGIWNTELLRSLLKEGKTAWETEIHIRPPSEMGILGTRQCPMRYANGILKGKLDPGQLEKLRPDDREMCKKWVPEEFLTEN